MSGGTAPVPFQPPNQAGAASAFQAGAGSLASQGQALYSQAQSGYNTLLQDAQANPYAGGAQTAANSASTAGQAFGTQEMQWGRGLQALGSSLGQYNPAIAQTAFDPQNALYNRTQGQVTDQANATNAASGLAGSPFGAGAVNQANENFNIDWQNNQQQRQNAGIAAIGANDATAGALTTAGGELGAQGFQTDAMAGQLPTQVYQENQGNIEQTLNALVNGENAASTQTQQSVADQGQYLNIGQTASQGALNSFEQQQKADQSFWSGIGGILGMGGGEGAGSSIASDALGFIGL
jgi:hypothetical protein